MDSVLDNLQKRSGALKFKLIHEQLNCGNYTFNSFNRQMSRILNEYLKYKSIFKAASIVGIDLKIVIKWYLQGQMGNPQFRLFYLRINHINDRKSFEDNAPSEENFTQEPVEDFVIDRYGDGWSYKTFVGGEKIFIISDDLNHLKRKVKSRNLPLN